MSDSNLNFLRIAGALIFSLLAHGLVLGLAAKPGREVKPPTLSGRKVVMRLTARPAALPRPGPVKPQALSARAASELRRSESVKIKPPPPAPPVLPAAEVIVHELPPPSLPLPGAAAGKVGEVGHGSPSASPAEQTLEPVTDSGSDLPVEILARPLYRQNPPPEYPALARRRQWQGTVILEVLVGAEGRAKEVSLQESSGHRVLDQVALQAVRSWLFEPGRRGGVMVAMKVLVPVRFGLE